MPELDENITPPPKQNARPWGRNLDDLWLDGETSKLHPAEWKLLECAASGEVCLLGETLPSLPTETTTIRAEFLRFLALGGDAQNPLHERGIQLVGAYVECEDDLDFLGTILPGNLTLTNCTIDGSIVFRDAQAETIALSGCTVHAILADRLVTTGGVYLNDNFEASGTVRFAGTKIGGDFDCTNGQFNNDNETLSCDGMETSGAVFLCDGFKAAGTVRLAGARIRKNLFCINGQFDGSDISLICDNVKTNGTVFLNRGFKASGTVRLLGAKIGADLACDSGQFNGKIVALHCDGIEVSGAVFLNDGFNASGTVKILAAKIRGDLACRNGVFRGPEVALHAHGAEFGGNCFLDHNFLAHGTVNLSSATIAHNLYCQGGTFSCKSQAIHAPRITVGDNINLGKDCRVAGQVSFQAAEVGGDITFAHGSFEGKPSVNLRNAKIEGMLVWRDIEHARGELNLSGASCRTLNMDWKSWEKPDQVRIDNFTYSGFSELPTGCDANFWTNWLERQPARHLEERYRPKPYAQLATVLDAMGHEEEARAIRIEQRKRQSLFTRKFEAVPNRFESKLARKLVVFWNFIQWLVVSYGYRPGKAVFFLFGMMVIGSVVYHFAARDGIMTPTHPLIFKEAAGGFIPKQCSKNWVYPANDIKAKCEAAIPSEYSSFNAIAYSIDTAIPVVNLRMESDWSPRVVTWDEGLPYSPGWWVRTWEWLQIAFGWGFSLLFVSAIGGVIRRN